MLTYQSVIHGKTGTGKSLLLAAIIGEANVLEGEVQIPQAPLMHMRGNESALMDDWIIPSALAFVGQIPWIENTSIKNTVLFGLPYHHERYIQVSQPNLHSWLEQANVLSPTPGPARVCSL